MTEYLWSKDGSAGTPQSIQQFLSGDDVVLDRELFMHDISATLAHAKALERLEVLSPVELEEVQRSLTDLAGKFRNGDYVLDAPFEDGHSAIEHWLTNELGDTGQKVHTGRSRNDQVQVALRLYMRDKLFQLYSICKKCSEAFLDRGKRDEWTPMPGYTHLQRAVPSSIGLWMGAFAESFVDIASLTRQTSQWINSCPLGTAAGYGVNLDLDRKLVSDQLGFNRIQLNPMYVQNSRGRFELQALSVLAQATLELRRLAWDLSLYTSEEFGFIRLPKDYVTGSSIMPNKSNPDTVELLRGQHAVVQGAITELQSITSLPSGYHRDLQLTKRPLVHAFRTSLLALGILPELVSSMEFCVAEMSDAIDDDMFATDIAVQRVVEMGIPFRQSYRTPSTEEEIESQSVEKSLKDRRSIGGCGNLHLDEIQSRLDQLDQTSS